VPEISIITINLNNAQGLQKTIQSVICQTFTNYEYIIIDGGSNDHSVEIIKNYQSKITFWISEPDKGIYNAMNKGILNSKGNYCLFLNSGDWLLNENAFENIMKLQLNEDIIYCDLADNNKGIVYPDLLSPYFFFKSSLGHPSALIKKKLFEKNGLYNEDYKIISDWEFFLKVILIEKCSYKHFPQKLTFFNDEGISSKLLELVKQERKHCFIKLFGESLFSDFSNYKICEEKLALYENSRIIRIVKKIQSSKIYQIFLKKQ
jgi:glycosyltransferase involved in cell wall biosynthesis